MCVHLILGLVSRHLHQMVQENVQRTLMGGGQSVDEGEELRVDTVNIGTS